MPHFLSRLRPPSDAGFVLALPFHHGDLESDCAGVSTRGERRVERRTRGGEMLPTLAVGWRASALRVEEAGLGPRSR